MYSEICCRAQDPASHLVVVRSRPHEMVLVRDIALYRFASITSSRFTGATHVAYIPGDDGRITGLSKLAIGRRVRQAATGAETPSPSLNADAIVESACASWRASVMIEAEHLCMSMRRALARPLHCDFGRARLFKENPATRAEVMSLLDPLGWSNLKATSDTGKCPHSSRSEPGPSREGRSLVCGGDPTDRRRPVPACAHGGRQRHPRLLLRRWPLPRAEVGDRPRASRCRAGAALLDVGGESTRPGGAGRRGRGAAPAPGASCRTSRPPRPSPSASTPRRRPPGAIEAGAADGQRRLRRYPPTPTCSASSPTRGVMLVVMHMRGTPRTMLDEAHYHDVVREVGDELRAVDAAVAAGIRAESILADPGIGFAPTLEHNFTLLAALPELAARRSATRSSGIAQVVSRTRARRRTGRRRERPRSRPRCGASRTEPPVVRVRDVAASIRSTRSSLRGWPMNRA